MLRERLGVEPADASEHVGLDAVRLPGRPRLPDGVARGGAAALFSGREQRIRHAAGRGYPDLVRLRSGRLEDAPDAVIAPESRPGRAAAPRLRREGVAVVPFGGGTSVVGGVQPLRGGHRCVIALDLTRLRSVELDRTSLTARLGPGLSGPDAERILGAQGVTLGHFPQSFEQATIGGFAATRSAGQASSGYEAAVAARGLPGRAGRGEAADRRVLEGLREVAERRRPRGQRRFRLGPAQAGAEARGQRAAVDLDPARAGRGRG